MQSLHRQPIEQYQWLLLVLSCLKSLLYFPPDFQLLHLSASLRSYDAGGCGDPSRLVAKQMWTGQDRTGQPFPSFLPYISNIPSATSAAFGTRQVCSIDQGHLLVTNGVNYLPKEEIPQFSFLLYLPLPTALGNFFG